MPTPTAITEIKLVPAPPTKEELEFHQRGIIAGRNSLFRAIYEYTDKPAFIHSLFRAAHNHLKEDVLMSHEEILVMTGYAEGIRHAMNIIDNNDTAKNAYKNIVGSDIPVFESLIK